MVAQSPAGDIGFRAPGFRLTGTDGNIYVLNEVRGQNGLLVMFICNHCPYVQAVLDRIIRVVRDLSPLGIGAVGINSNDAASYPEDSFENMVKASRARGFPFPYLHDPTQDVARAYGAVCTPDFFGFNRDLRLRYRGRLDASRKEAAPPDAKRELLEAMTMIAETGTGPAEQHPALGCSIKWRADNP
ncbi:MAG TPA: thioredoxin family protein [Burkholderiales bacterium]|nr:thioredoxin family protein [Burkholderiales bacterium]